MRIAKLYRGVGSNVPRVRIFAFPCLQAMAACFPIEHWGIRRQAEIEPMGFPLSDDEIFKSFNVTSEPFLAFVHVCYMMAGRGRADTDRKQTVPPILDGALSCQKLQWLTEISSVLGRWT